MIDDVLRAADGGVHLAAYMMIGFPTETEEEALMSNETLMRYIGEGLLHSYYYSFFGIQKGSHIHKNKEQYGIGNIKYQDGFDLPNDSKVFACSGMTREKGYELCNRFNIERIKDEEKLDDGDRQKLKTIIFKGRKIVASHDIFKIREVISRRYDYLYKPFVKWLQSCDIKFSRMDGNDD